MACHRQPINWSVQAYAALLFFVQYKENSKKMVNYWKWKQKRCLILKKMWFLLVIFLSASMFIELGLRSEDERKMNGENCSNSLYLPTKKNVHFICVNLYVSVSLFHFICSTKWEKKRRMDEPNRNPHINQVFVFVFALFVLFIS